MAFLQPGDIVDDGDGPGLDAAVIAIDGLVPADGGVLEILGFLLGREQFDVFPQRALIALQGQDVVGLLVHDLPGDGALAAHGVDGDDGTLDGQHVEQLGDGEDLVGLVRHLDLPQHQPLARGEGRDHVDGCVAALLSRSTRGLAVDGDHPFRNPDQRRHPGDEAAWNCSASRLARMSPRWSWAGVPSRNGRNRRKACASCRRSGRCR